MEKVLKSAQVEGVVSFSYSDNKDNRCPCCPDGRHAYGRGIKLERWWPDAPHWYEPWGVGISDFARYIACRHQFVGKRVRVTVEVLGDSEEPRS